MAGSASPWPLSSRYFLVSFSFGPADNIANGYGLYLLDIYGNLESIYRDQKQSCYSPIPIRPRPRSHVLAARTSNAADATPATMVLQDVYQGLDGVPRGTVRWLRVLESHTKKGVAKPQQLDVGIGSGTDPRSVLGTVPVDEDGSAYFTVPPGKHLFFEALDKDHLEIRRMRNYVAMRPGETIGCVGCHEPYAQRGDGPRALPLRSATPAVADHASALGCGANGFPLRHSAHPGPALHQLP